MERQLESDTCSFWTFALRFLAVDPDIVHSPSVTVIRSKGHVYCTRLIDTHMMGKASNVKRTVALSLAKRLLFICSFSAHSHSRSGSYLLHALVHTVFGKED